MAKPPRKKRKSNKASKGAQFERKLARRLSLWWTEGEHDDWFWRSSNSGGRATVRRRSGRSTHKQAGDIAATHPGGALLLDVMCFELKCGYSTATVTDIFDKPSHLKNQKWEDFWIQARRDAKANDAWAWMLITKRNSRAPMAWVPGHLAHGLRELGCPLPPISFVYDGNRVFGSMLDAWLEAIEPEDIKELAELKLG